MKIMREAFSATDRTVELLHKAGIPTTAIDMGVLTEELFNSGLLEGNWDCSIVLENGVTVRCINDDEYEQHMDEDEKPRWDDMLGNCGLGYIWVEQ